MTKYHLLKIVKDWYKFANLSDLTTLYTWRNLNFLKKYQPGTLFQVDRIYKQEVWIEFGIEIYAMSMMHKGKQESSEGNHLWKL